MSDTNPNQNPIPKERDRVTGESGDLGVWPDDVGLAPVEVWDGRKAVFAYVTHAHLGEHLEVGEDVAIIFKDRAVLCSVDDVATGDPDEEDCDA